jgi:hypothetical protein
MNRPNLCSTSDLMNLVAQCLENRDPESTELLEGATAVVRGWLQPEAEAAAQLALIEAALAAVLDLAD